MIEPVDPNLSDLKRSEALSAMWQQMYDAARATEGGIELPEEDIALLQRYAQDDSWEVRVVAVKALTMHGPVSWEDFTAWALDPKDHVRREATANVELGYGAVAELCSSDKARTTQILSLAVEKHHDRSIARSLWWMSDENRDWLDAIWPEIGRLLDLQEPEIFSMLTCGYVEDALQDYDLGPDNLLVNDWITGNSVSRKLSLLAVALWLQLEQDNLRQIAEALTKDFDLAVAWIAKAILRKHLPKGEIGIDFYATVSKWLANKKILKANS